MPIKTAFLASFICRPLLFRPRAFSQFCKSSNSLFYSSMSTPISVTMPNTAKPKVKGPKGGNKAPIFEIPMKERLFSAEDGSLLKEIVCFSFYHFSPINDPDIAAQTLHNQLKTESLMRFAGTCYLAKEGLNAQFSVASDFLPEFLDNLRATANNVFDCSVDLDINIGETLGVGIQAPFKRFRVVSRPQILTDGLDQEFDWSDPGPEIDSKDWHHQLAMKSSDTKPLLLDCRNDYESNVGTFDGAIPLKTKTFAESWKILDEMVKDKPKDETIYAFCTGGIRCVKVGAYLKQKHGLTDVRRLRHGTIAYEKWTKQQKREREESEEGGHADEDIEPKLKKSIFKGTNFIFDQRPLNLDGVSSDKDQDDVKQGKI